MPAICDVPLAPTEYLTLGSALPPLAPQFQPALLDTSVFVQSTPDSLNRGVFRPDGTRKSPTYDHHVDNSIYGDVEEFVSLDVAASVLALYLLLGYPGPRNRDSMS